MASIRALVLNCTLKRSPAPSSAEALGREVLDALAEQGVAGDLVRVVDQDVRFGVSVDEGDGDGWPAIRSRLMAAQILVIATPIWLGQPSAVCKMVLERLDAELSETDAEGRLLTYGKVAGVAVVGNEDGAHHTIAEVQQALNEVGFTCPAAGATYWVGEALHTTDYLDARPKPDTTGRATQALALNSAHLARLLTEQPYPPPDTRGASVGPSREPA
ncbi:NAD(P)H-dependent oxidoreductase [Micromonospora sp. C31]|uniref:flavodoxin family protein n=1 Tax=Micromonospora sp. C31 TaxID=2824876 RepID=UPI001B364E5C|nr:NAD(P)H-dependent oxidoreductase [Micromonospora sp. C31]MBQ1073150.1 NAD(P)H-dependent oxidoreductase [Micromonospora sp. C31]